jgi:hypothetical protein
MPFPSQSLRIQIGNLSPIVMRDVKSSILSCSTSYGMDKVTEVSMRIHDPGFQFSSNNYFNIGRDVLYTTKTIRNITTKRTDNVAEIDLIDLKMEIAEISVDQGDGINPIWTINCRTKAIQQMKRDKQPGTIVGDSTDYVRAAAKKYGLEFVGEATDKKKQITKASGDNEADSVWDVISNLASQAKFKVFEADGVLYFASMKWLLHKWGSHSISYKVEAKDKSTGKISKVLVTKSFIPLVSTPEGKLFELMKMPSLSKSDNDPMEAQGQAVIARANGTAIRPGMTVYVGGIPTMEGYYLVTAVDFDELSPDPVGISFATPERRPKEKPVYLPVGPRFPATDDGVGPDLLIHYIKTGSVRQLPALPPYGKSGL